MELTRELSLKQILELPPGALEAAVLILAEHDDEADEMTIKVFEREKTHERI